MFYLIDIFQISRNIIDNIKLLKLKDIIINIINYIIPEMFLA